MAELRAAFVKLLAWLSGRRLVEPARPPADRANANARLAQPANGTKQGGIVDGIAPPAVLRPVVEATHTQGLERTARVVVAPRLVTYESGRISDVAPVEQSDIAGTLQTFAAYRRCFTSTEFGQWLGGETDMEKAREILSADNRFVSLGNVLAEDYFVPEVALFTWWCRFTYRLARAGRDRLDQRQLALGMSSLRSQGRWHNPPEAAVRFGQDFGFVASTTASGEYVFPLAYLLSDSLGLSWRVAVELLDGLADKDARNANLDKTLEEWVAKGFSSFDAKVVRVIELRQGIKTGTKITLEEIGQSLGVSRERVRQIESKFWFRLWEHRNRRFYIRPFVTGFLYDTMRRQGSLVIDRNSPDANLRQFVAKCVKIPQVEVPNTELVVLGAHQEGFAVLDCPEWFPEGLDPDAVQRELERNVDLCQSSADLGMIAQAIARFRRDHMTKGQKVYLALREIGRPAHYSEITLTYHTLFLEDESSEHSIHAVLDREENQGIVWVGVRGTYALKEWGYERPSKSLYEAACEIVEKKFKETGRPVPFEVVAAEMGKYRQVVNPHSLVFATHCNPKLRCVSGNSFIPRENGGDDPELTADELDNALRNFEKREELAPSE